MLINCDAKGLEIVCAAFLSQDEVLCKEIINNFDTHEDNRQRFNLPTRLIAKTFVFRLIYGGTAYSYANDPDFTGVSTNEDYWQGIIEEFYDKYKGVSRWHERIMGEATSTGKLRMPTGRFYNFESTQRGSGLVWPRTKILNYPVQGLGADVMSIARVSFHKRFKQSGIIGEETSTIHDSIVVDVADNEVERTCLLLEDVFNDLPKNFTKYFKVDFNLPTRCEISFGKNKNNLQVWTKGSII